MLCTYGAVVTRHEVGSSPAQRTSGKSSTWWVASADQAVYYDTGGLMVMRLKELTHYSVTITLNNRLVQLGSDEPTV